MKRKLKTIAVAMKDHDGKWHTHRTTQFTDCDSAKAYYVQATQLPAENVRATFAK